MKMRKPWLVAVIVVAIILVLSLMKDMMIKVSVEKGVEILTGLKVGMKGFHVGLVRTVVDIKRLAVYNPKGFEERLMLDAPRIYVDYDLPAVLKKDIHLRKLIIDVQKFVVVKSRAGKLNLNSLMVVRSSKPGARAPEKKEAEPMKVRIDELQLKIGKAYYKDYTSGAQPSVTEFDANVDEIYRNVTDPQYVVGIIVVRALANTTISRLANFDIGSLKDKMSFVLDTAQNVASQATTAAQGAVSETKEVVGTGQKAVEDTAKSLGSILSAVTKTSDNK